jgi:hypothetical protein
MLRETLLEDCKCCKTPLNICMKSSLPRCSVSSFCPFKVHAPQDLRPTFYYNTHAGRVTAYIIQVDPTATVGRSVPHKGPSEERARVRFHEFFEFFFEFFFVSDTRYHTVEQNTDRNRQKNNFKKRTSIRNM